MTDIKKKYISAGSRQVAEESIDLSKNSQTRTWQETAAQSSVMPWARMKKSSRA